MVLGLVGFFFTVLFYGLFGEYDTDSVTITNSAQPEVTQTVSQKKSKTKKVKNKEKRELSADDLTVKDYSYEDSIGDTLHIYVVKNNSDKTVSVSSNAKALDKSGEVIGAASGELEVLGAGCESVFYEFFESVKDIVSYKYKLSVQEESFYSSVTQDIQCKKVIKNDKVIVTCMNKGSEAAEFVEAHALFFKKGKLVNYDSTFVIDDDSELKAGQSRSEQIESYEKFDDVKVYLTGRR